MDRSSELADAYVEIRFGDLDPQRSGIARKTLNPVWNHDFRLEISDDSMLQNEPLEIRVLDYDAITANDAVGSVLIDLDPLLQMDRVGQILGWFPLYDTLRGIRGEIHVQIRLQFFGDINPFKESSTGMQVCSGVLIS
jgi:Ca2+-dependent lipid-binding protein